MADMKAAALKAWVTRRANMKAASKKDGKTNGKPKRETSKTKSAEAETDKVNS